MKFIIALKKYFEDDPRIGKLTTAELMSFKKAITDEDRANYTPTLAEYHGVEIDSATA